MSKTLGMVLLLGLLGSAVLSLALLLWIWTRSENAPTDKIDKNKPVTPLLTPKTSVTPQALAPSYWLVDARNPSAAWAA